ncbi:MAG: hypothetical protein AB7F89_15885 [Pirellulaceae bacterium]
MACNLLLTESSGAECPWVADDAAPRWESVMFDVRRLRADHRTHPAVGLEYESQPGKAHRGARQASLFHCPWCGSRELLDGAQAGWWCLDCEELAWCYTATGIARTDYP